VVPEVAPPQALGLVGGLFNASGNLAGIVTPVTIGLIVQATGSFAGALYFVGGVAFVGAIAWILVVGPIRQVDMKDQIPKRLRASSTVAGRSP
jgi:ACS family D-galactonate transporter-like MFS transporter